MARADGLVVLARVLSLGFLSVTASAEPTTGTPPRMCRDSVYALALRPWDPPAAPRQEFPAEREDLAAAMRLNELAERSLEARAYARDLYVAEERYLDAEPLYRRSLAILERTFGPTDVRVAALCEKRARLLLKLHIPASTVPPKAGRM